MKRWSVAFVVFRAGSDGARPGQKRDVARGEAVRPLVPTPPLVLPLLHPSYGAPCFRVLRL